MPRLEPLDRLVRFCGPDLKPCRARTNSAVRAGSTRYSIWIITGDVRRIVLRLASDGSDSLRL